MSRSQLVSRIPSPGIAGCAVMALAFVCLVVTGVAYVGRYVYRSSPRLLEGLSSQTPAEAAYRLSADQQSAVTERGYPEGFSIFFYEPAEDDPSVLATRYEIWSYLTDGVDLVFLNGSLVDSSDEGGAEDDLLPAPYRPEQFDAGMRFQQVVDATGLETAVVIPVEPELVSEGEVYFAEQLILGLKGRQVQYVEALPLPPGE